MSNTDHILEGAKKALASANKFTASVKKDAPDPAPQRHEPQHEYKDASYSMVKKAANRAAGTLGDEAKSAGEGIKSRMEMEAAARKSLD